ncbi:metallophosphoesterase [Azospirillum formosense]|uniref:Metallophosphoesterase n=1 Tax=Azospirillum formosense TaxID=861533 RepID=A0ABX2L1T9_9PROT|nr:TIGR00282 family metallophosphoesterase [Azospirillum formosense]MBY3753366.1 YmdB family metallophosphoesterase [Azospirillum formosense]NUB22285.1 metallophosphoesterase [Azospirillum formosense]
MRLLFLGDVVGRSGRDAVIAHMPMLRDRLDPDLTVVNGENAAGGFGITVKIAEEFFAAGVDVVTLGNHSWDQKELVAAIDQQPRIIRPLNYPEGTPGRGFVLLQARGGRKVLVMNVMLRLFMDPMDDPFAAVERVLRAHRLGPNGADAILVDVHGEATSEKMIMGHFCDGRASLVVGTHSHVPTADHVVMKGGTAYLTDAGMCGDYDSAIGMKKEVAMAKLIRKLPTERLSPAEGEGTVCGCYVETDDRTGLATSIQPVRLGGRLSQSMPVRG